MSFPSPFSVRLTLALLALLPLAQASWLAYVDANPFATNLSLYTDSNGCLFVIEGNPTALVVYTAEGADEYRNVGRYICLPADIIATLEIQGSDVVLRLPDANVYAGNVLLSDLRLRRVNGGVLVHTSPDLRIPLALAVIALLSALFFLRKRKPATQEESVIEYIASHPGCTQKEISKALGLEKYQVTRILQRLEQRGVIVRVRHGISKRVYLREQLQ